MNENKVRSCKVKKRMSTSSGDATNASYFANGNGSNVLVLSLISFSLASTTANREHDELIRMKINDLEKLGCRKVHLIFIFNDINISIKRTFLNRIIMKTLIMKVLRNMMEKDSNNNNIMSSKKVNIIIQKFLNNHSNHLRI